MKWSVNEVMYNAVAQKEFITLYKETFGKGVVCGTCPGNLYRDYFKLKNYLSLPLNKQDMQSTKNFVLVTGAMITHKGTVYSEKYLPDAAAIDIIISDPKKRKKFKFINEDLLKESPVVETEVIEKVMVIDEVTGTPTEIREEVQVKENKKVEVKAPAKRGRKSKK
jgi:hypothetical protein